VNWAYRLRKSRNFGCLVNYDESKLLRPRCQKIRPRGRIRYVVCVSGVLRARQGRCGLRCRWGILPTTTVVCVDTLLQDLRRPHLPGRALKFETSRIFNFKLHTLLCNQGPNRTAGGKSINPPAGVYCALSKPVASLVPNVPFCSG